MSEQIFISFLIALFVLFTITFIILLNKRRHHIHLKNRYQALEGEEQRMIDFLHHLGTLIENDPTMDQLSKIIVDGINEVITADGGAIYFIDETEQFLNPSYISENCPPLTGISIEMKKKAIRNPQILKSHFRLERIPIGEGAIGNILVEGEVKHVSNMKNEPMFRDSFLEYPDDVEALMAPLRYANKNIGVLIIAQSIHPKLFSKNDITVFRAVAEQAAFAIGNAKIHLEANDKRMLERELIHAREVQRILLPQEDPELPGYRISGVNVPARIISGDYYDFLPINEDQYGIVIADVSGKGVPAGLLMAMCRSVIRSFAFQISSPTQVLSAVNQQLYPDIREDMFITSSYVRLDQASGKVSLARAGHEPTLWYRKKLNQVDVLRSPGLALGIDGGDVFERVTKDQEILIEQGDVLLLFTDGVKEAMNHEDAEYGLERIIEVFQFAAQQGASKIIETIQKDIKNFTGNLPQMDDITMVVIERKMPE